MPEKTPTSKDLPKVTKTVRELDPSEQDKVRGGAIRSGDPDYAP